MPELARSLRLRPFVLADAGTIEPWLSAPGLTLPAGRLRSQWPQRLLADGRIKVLVAELHGRRIGFVRLDCGPDDIAEITLVVAPGMRRGGLGSAMFLTALQQARALRLRGLVASVDLANATALAFFDAQGFRPEGVVGGRVRMWRFVHAGDHAAPLDV